MFFRWSFFAWKVETFSSRFLRINALSRELKAFSSFASILSEKCIVLREVFAFILFTQLCQYLFEMNLLDFDFAKVEMKR